jgi:hypothetical protein
MMLAAVMPAAVERRFGIDRVPHPVEHLPADGSRYTARETRDFAPASGLVPCLAPVRPPGRREARMSESLVRTPERPRSPRAAPRCADRARAADGWVADRNAITLAPPPACARPSSSARRSTPAGLSRETGGSPHSWFLRCGSEGVFTTVLDTFPRRAGATSDNGTPEDASVAGAIGRDRRNRFARGELRRRVRHHRRGACASAGDFDGPDLCARR